MGWRLWEVESLEGISQLELAENWALDSNTPSEGLCWAVWWGIGSRLSYGCQKPGLPSEGIGVQFVCFKVGT